MVFFPENFAGLVKFSYGYTDEIQFRVKCCIDQFLFGQCDAVDAAERV